jgi:hypothetical protein
VGTLIADIFVTVKPDRARFELTKRSIRSLIENTDGSQYRLTVCLDGMIDDVPVDDPPEVLSGQKYLHMLQYNADYILQSAHNEGLGPTINRAVTHIQSVNDWYGHPTHGDPNKVAPLIVMCQDDLLYSDGWLPVLASRFFAYEKTKKIGFASGVECIEHPVREVLGKDLVTKDWIRASQMMARREYWTKLLPIPRFDPETGRVRAKPNDGMGSGVDWWLIRNHDDSVCKSGRTNLVIPGLVVHAGYDKSTWLKRDLPESDSDKIAMKERK